MTDELVKPETAAKVGAQLDRLLGVPNYAALMPSEPAAYTRVDDDHPTEEEHRARASAVLHRIEQHKERFAPVPALIKHCETLLELAKSGKLRSLAYAQVTHDDLVVGGEVDHGLVLTPFTKFAMCAAMTRLSRAWSDEYNDIQVTFKP